MRKFSKFWRDSASLIILARDGGKIVPRNEYNYKILVFKRSEKTSFMPNSIVFPGGAFDKSDEVKDWNSLFEKAGVAGQLDEITQVRGPRSFIFENDEDKDSLDRNISLRLTAIRESFEELGVLFCTDKNQLLKKSDNFVESLEDLDVVKWQNAVHDNEKQFIDLCESLNVVPDLWNTFEWSTWLTPSMFRKRRFETTYYIAALNDKPKVFPEAHEVQEYLWETPKALLEAHRDEKLWLPPPQLYEISRLSHIHNIDDVMEFAKNRNKKGTTLYYPIQFKCSDGMVHVLPGDDLYPKFPSYTAENEDYAKYEDITRDELRSRTVNIHRAEHNSLYDTKLFLNHTPLDGHLHPLGDNSNKSKL